MTTRVTWEAAKSTEAEPGQTHLGKCPITLHDASLAAHMDATLTKVNGRAGCDSE